MFGVFQLDGECLVGYYCETGVDIVIFIDFGVYKGIGGQCLFGLYCLKGFIILILCVVGLFISVKRKKNFIIFQEILCLYYNQYFDFNKIFLYFQKRDYVISVLEGIIVYRILVILIFFFVLWVIIVFRVFSMIFSISVFRVFIIYCLFRVVLRFVSCVTQVFIVLGMDLVF